VSKTFKKILVTGGAGFIGSHFIKHLLKVDSSIEVINLDLLTYAGNLNNLTEIKNHPSYRFVKGDIRDVSLVSELLTQCNAVINFAAESHVDRSITGPEAFIQTNIFGTFCLLEAVRKNPSVRFIQISTDEVYGSLGSEGSFSEESPIQPNSPYSASKASADLLCRSYFHTFNLDILITRCSNNYGPNQFPEKLIPLMIHNASSNESLPVYGDGLNIRDWIFVDDHCSAIVATLKNGSAGEVYNVGSDNEWTNLQIVKKLLQILDRPESLIKYVKDRPGHDKRYAINSAKIKSNLGWAPKTNFEEGLNRTVSWYRHNLAWVKEVTSGDYLKFYEKQYGPKKS
jgi:dTDP-glucose 4,6-dehydratase